jgi:hypothetical protein
MWLLTSGFRGISRDTCKLARRPSITKKKKIKHITIEIKSIFLCLILEKKIEHITIEIKSIFLFKKLSLKTLLNIFITIYYQVSNMMIHLRS